MPQINDLVRQGEQRTRPIRVGLVFVAFPAKDITPYKYYLLLLNHLQRSCEFELYDVDEDDDFIRLLGSNIVDADEARRGLEAFGTRLHQEFASAIKEHDLADDRSDPSWRMPVSRFLRGPSIL